MRRCHLSVVVLLLVAYLLVQNAECRNNRTKGHLLVDGIDVEKLSEKEVYGLLNAEDEKFMGQLDVWIGKQTLKERHRIRRFGALSRVALTAARALFKSLGKSTPRISTSGGRITKQYFKKGDFNLAKTDFGAFKPTDVKHIMKKDGFEVYTGRILDGRYQLTVRSSSTYGRIMKDGKVVEPGKPTLEIRPNVGERILRKFRYDEY